MEDQALYRPILKKAKQITMDAKHLWFLGLFAALVGSGEVEIAVRAFTNPNDENGILNSVIKAFSLGWQDGIAQNNGSFWTNLWSTFVSKPSAFLVLALLLLGALAIGLFFLWLAITAQAGLIKNADLLSKNKKTTINQGIEFGVKNFWPTLAANLILKVMLAALFLLLGREVFFLLGLGLAGQIIFYLSFVVFVTVVIVVSFLTRYQIFFILLKGKKFWVSLSEAWKLFKANWLISLEMAVVMFVIYFLGALLISVAGLILLAIPFALTFYLSVAGWIFILSLIIALILTVSIAFVVTAWVNAFQWVGWVLLFNSLLSSDITISKIIRTAGQLPTYFAPKA